MTREEAKDTIAAAVAAIHAAYWTVCDSEGRAVDPLDLDAPSDLLDEAHDIALSVEAIADERGLSWADARDLI
jgi:hypothetical protein